MMSETRSDYYGYNDRSELVSGTKDTAATNLTEYAYQYDDIGNRLSSLDLGTNRTYAANALNQYTNIVKGVDEFVPLFDLDGNQTLIKTATGVWNVTYNGENRPVQWECGSTNIVMKFDRMGRRAEYIETVSGVTNAHHRFVYDGYLCIQRLNAAANNSIDLVFGWDPSEAVATKPLWMQKPTGSYNFFYFHDGNKNVSDLVSYQTARGVPAHYEYAPFGELTVSTTNTAFTAFNVAKTNPYRFSSEYADDELGLVYYNYRHYNPTEGRWVCEEQLNEMSIGRWYVYVNNSSLGHQDFLGLLSVSINRKQSDDPMVMRLVVTPEDIGEGCELNFIQLAFNQYEQKWVVDNKNYPYMPKTLGPYYIDWDDEYAKDVLKNNDGNIIFFDQPNVQTYFYLFIVENCCVERYKGSKQCGCCKKSRATVLDRIYWTTLKGKAKIHKVTNKIRSKMDDLLQSKVNASKFPVICDQYMEDNKDDPSKKYDLEMEMEVEINLGR